jgi:5-methylcytosine-specific restriction enzyme A
MTLRRPCLDCGRLTRNATRCTECARNQDRARGTAAQRGYGWRWQRYAHQAIAGFRASHGDICPGWSRRPHPIAPTEWTVDHHIGPLCRACNSRKAATVDRMRARRAAVPDRGVSQDPRLGQIALSDEPPSVA